jgi:phage-related protein
MAADDAVFTFDIKPFLDSIKTMENSLKGMASRVRQIGDTIIKGIETPVASGIKGISDAVKKMGSAIAGGAKDTIKSVSEGMNKLGQNVKDFGQGVADILTQPFKKVISTVQTAGKGMVDAITAPIQFAQQSIQKLSGMIPGPIKKGVSDAVNGSAAAAKKLGQAITDSIKTGVKAGITEIGKIFVAFNAAKKLFSDQMPEVGQAFSIAADIALKNFFYPIRQLLLPFLNNMLKWVTDHRALFIRWGTAVANVLRAVILVAKQLWDIFKGFLDAIGNSLQKALGTHFKSFDEFLNMLSFKIAAIIIWLGMICKSLNADFTKAFEWIFEQGKRIIDFFVEFVSNLVKLAVDTGTFTAALELIKTAIQGIISIAGTFLESMEQIIAMLLTPNKSGDNIATILESLRAMIDELVSTIQLAITEFTAGFMEAASEIATPIREIIEHITGIIKAFNSEDGAEVFREFGRMVGNALMGVADLLSNVAASAEKLIVNLLKTGTITEAITLLDAAIQGIISIADTFVIEAAKIINALILPNQSGDNIATILHTIKNTIDTLTPAIKMAITEFTAGFMEAASEIATPVRTIIEHIKSMVEAFHGEEGQKAMRALGNLIGTAFQGGAEIVERVANAFARLLENLFKKQDGVSIGTIMENIAEAFKKVKDIGVTITAGFLDGFIKGIENIAKPIDDAINAVNNFLKALGNDKAGLKKTAEAVGNAIGKAFKNGADLVAGTAHAMTNLADQIFRKQDGASLFSVIESISEAFSSLTGVIKNIGIGFFKGFTDSLGNIMKPINDAINAVNDLIEALGKDENKGLQRIAAAIGKTFGGAFQGVAAIISTLATAVSNFAKAIFTKENGNTIADILESLGDSISSIKNTALNISKSLFSGFIDGLSSIGTPVNNVLTAVKPLVEQIKDFLKILEGSGDSGSLSKTAESAGKVIGGVLLITFTALAEAIDTAATALRMFITLLAGTGDDTNRLNAIKQMWEERNTRSNTNRGIMADAARGIINTVTGGSVKINDAIITKTGQVIQTDPDDTIIAAKQIMGGGKNGKGGSTINISFGSIYITVTEGDAEQAGRDFGQAMARSLADSISAEMLLEGY